MSISQQRRQDILDALRRGTVPQYGLDALAVGLLPFERAFDEELEKVSRGGRYSRLFVASTAAVKPLRHVGSVKKHIDSALLAPRYKFPRLRRRSIDWRRSIGV